MFGGHRVDLLADLGQPVALAEAHRRRRRRAGAHGVAVPAPHRAVARDELLAGLEAGLQRGAGGIVGHDADEGEAARQLGQRLDVIAERRGAGRQRRRIGDRAERQPVDRRAAVGRGFELVAERSAQRRLEARLDGERIEQRRPQRIGRRLQRRGNACLLGAQLGEPRIDLLQALGGGGVARLGGRAIGGAGALQVDALGLGLGHRLARGVGFVALGLAGGVDRLLTLLARLVESGCGRRRARPRPRRAPAGRQARSRSGAAGRRFPRGARRAGAGAPAARRSRGRRCRAAPRRRRSGGSAGRARSRPHGSRLAPYRAPRRRRRRDPPRPPAPAPAGRAGRRARRSPSRRRSCGRARGQDRCSVCCRRVSASCWAWATRSASAVSASCATRSRCRAAAAAASSLRSGGSAVAASACAVVARPTRRVRSATPASASFRRSLASASSRSAAASFSASTAASARRIWSERLR